MGKRIIAVIVLIVVLSVTSVQAISFKNRVKLTGGAFSTKSMALWELEKYKYTTLLRKSPLCWCPYHSYLYVDQYVVVENKNNKNWLKINANLIDLVKDEANYNKAHAKKYKGSAKKKVKKIFRYCANTEYVPHVKFAKDVFSKRQGDCAAISAAFYVMCKKNKIPVRYVIGWAYGECHAWNRVKIGKKWYWIDPTFEQWISRKQLEQHTVMEMW